MHPEIECPVCKKIGLKITFHSHEIPYFGEAIEEITRCSNCNYRHVDTLILEEKGPVEYSLKIDGERDMLIRVIRSSHATIEIPELGVKITPGVDSEGYITNVEGVLERIEDAIRTAKKAADQRTRKDVDALMKRIGSLKEGKGGATLYLADPTGNSAIVSEKAIKNVPEGEKR